MTPPRLVWERASLLATLVSMVTARVERKREVVKKKRTGCSESVRWLETLADTFPVSSVAS